MSFVLMTAHKMSYLDAVVAASVVKEFVAPLVLLQNSD